MIKEKMKQLIGKSINKYNTQHVKDVVSELKFKEQYQGRIIDCMVGEVDDNYIETPETDSSIVKLEHSKEGLIKVHSIKGKTILVDSDGNETDTPGEGCRLVSVGEEDNKLIILSRDYNFELGTFGNGIGVKYVAKSSTNRIRTQNLIDVKPTNTYIVTCSEGYEITTGMFDSNNICQQNHPRTQRELIIKPNSNIVKMGIIVRKTDNSDLTEDDILKANIQIEGELKQHKTEILLNEPLRSLPNGVCDEIVGNKLIRRVGKVTLTGEEGWWSNWTNVSFFEWFSNLRITNWKPISDNITWYSNKLKSTTSYSIEHEGQFNCFCFGVDWNATNPKVIVRPSYDIVEEGNVDQFKEWLKKNNMIILYELAEPIIEELPNSITIQGFDDTTMYIENSITPTVTYGYNALIPYKEEVLNQQQEVETNTLDIEQNIIPYLMDMEFNLMLMEDE